MAQDIIFSMLHEDQMKNVDKCEMVNEIWDILVDLCKEADQITCKKLQVCIEKYASFTMINGESILLIDDR